MKPRLAFALCLGIAACAGQDFHGGKDCGDDEELGGTDVTPTDGAPAVVRPGQDDDALFSIEHTGTSADSVAQVTVEKFEIITVGKRLHIGVPTAGALPEYLARDTKYHLQLSYPDDTSKPPTLKIDIGTGYTVPLPNEDDDDPNKGTTTVMRRSSDYKRTAELFFSGHGRSNIVLIGFKKKLDSKQ